MNIPKEVQQALDKDYKLVPMADITDEARVIAVRWVEGYEPQGMDIPGKQKLASDIMNYARRHSEKLLLDHLKQLNTLAKQAMIVKQQYESNIEELVKQIEFRDEEIKMLKHLRHDSE